jgi:hypothetical protein
MNYPDQISQHYSAILDGIYECIDRIVINGYFIRGNIPGGFRNWWRQLYGSDDNLDKAHLMKMAGRFSRRVKGFIKHTDIPLIYCKPGERKHELAEQFIPKVNGFTGIFLILVSKCSATVWDVDKSTKHLEKKKPYCFVNHYWFHIIDKDWGHITIKISGHPPFGVQVMLNGHEWVERKAITNGVQIKKEGNCFTFFEDQEALCNIAETLWQKGRLQRVCDYWAYRCLWFGLKEEEQQKSGFFYNFYLYQVELSRNFLFHRGTQLDEIYQNIIDLTRCRLDVKRLKTIFGYKHRPHNRKHKKNYFEIRIERPMYNMTVFKIDDGKITVKMYDKGERVLRIEVICHNAKELNCKRDVDNFPMIIKKLRQILDLFVNVLYFSHVSFIDKGEFDQISQPTKKGKHRLAGIDLNKPRCRNVMKAVLQLSTKAEGFTSRDVATRYEQIAQISDQSYKPRHAAYDLRKLKAKGLVQMKKNSRKYRVTTKGVSTIVATIVIREKIFKPIMAGINKKKLAMLPQKLSKVDRIYLSIREKILNICKEYGVVGVIM